MVPNSEEEEVLAGPRDASGLGRLWRGWDLLGEGRRGPVTLSIGQKEHWLGPQRR